MNAEVSISNFLVNWNSLGKQRMLNIPAIMLGLSILHLCMATDPIAQEKERERFFALRHPGDNHASYLSKPLPPKENKGRLLTVDAAMGIYLQDTKYVYLFTGNQVQVLKDSFFAEEKPRKEFHVPDDMHLQAAFATQDDPDKRVYYGDEYGKFVSVLDDIKKRKLRYGPARAFIRHGGPDAAGRLSGKVYVFKGCKMAVRKNWNNWGEVVDVQSVGLPCDIDAAWNDLNKMVILQGDRVWRWYDDGRVEGPLPFSALYSLRTGDALKPKVPERPIPEEPEKLYQLQQPEQPDQLQQPEKLEQLQQPENRDQLQEPEKLDQLQQTEKLEQLQEPEKLDQLQEPEKLDQLQEPEKLDQLQEPEKLDQLQEPEKLYQLQEPEQLEQLEQLEERRHDTEYSGSHQATAEHPGGLLPAVAFWQ